nr:fused MFS/spermidine synthase [Micrococcus sp. KRD096]
MRWAAAAVRAHWPEPTPLRALHLGGAGCALARWVDHAYPGSHQTAVEIDAGLAALARERFGLPRAPALRIRVADAAEVLATAHPASRDLIIRDVFAPDPTDLTGARHITPPGLTGLDAARAAARVLAPGGLYVLNVGGGPDLTSVRADVAAVVAAFEHVEVIADPPMLKGRRRGNVIVAASDAPVARPLSMGTPRPAPTPATAWPVPCAWTPSRPGSRRIHAASPRASRPGSRDSSRAPRRRLEALGRVRPGPVESDSRRSPCPPRPSPPPPAVRTHRSASWWVWTAPTSPSPPPAGPSARPACAASR